MMLSSPLRAPVLAALLFLAGALRAEPAVELEPVQVAAPSAMLDRDPSPTHRIAGGVARVEADSYADRYSLTLRDMLAWTPGVIAQPRFAEEVRLSIRGSGLARGFHLRGIELLVDGVPINLADGSGDFQELDPLLYSHIDVYRGASALSRGAATLGGAIEFTTPTGRAAVDRGQLRFEAGSHGTVRLHASHAVAGERADAWIGATTSYSDGWRDQSRTASGRLAGNTGWRWSDHAETRVWLNINALNAELPGTLSLADALSNPQQTTPIGEINDYGRDIRSVRTAVRHRVELDNGLGQGRVDVGGYYFQKRLYHPVFQIVDQNGDFHGGFVRYLQAYTLFGLDAEWTLGAVWRDGSNDARRFINERGLRGALTVDAVERADQLTLYAEHRLAVTQRLVAIAGVQWLRATRDFEDLLNPDNSDDIRYQRASPSVGLIYALRDGVQWFANVSRSAEPASFSELNQARPGETGFVPLALQRAWSVESGLRGGLGAWDWDLTVYHARLRGELLQFTTDQDIPASTFNADRTVHQGVEAGLRYALTAGLDLGGVWTYSDFRFDADARYGDNRLAGVPRHFGRVDLRMRWSGNGGEWHLSPGLEMASSATVDFANTLTAPGWAVLQLSGGWTRGPLSLFTELRNLGDHRYVSNFSTITDARLANTNVFYPGEGRSVYAGVRHAF
jgi:iron complex outermembrane receptor protein